MSILHVHLTTKYVHINVRKNTRFTKCSACAQLRSAIAISISRDTSTSQLKAQEKDHSTFISRERCEYRRKIELAGLRTTESVSFTIDGADQIELVLCHFKVRTKDQGGYGLSVHLICLLRNELQSKLQLFTMTENNKTGSKQIIEPVKRFLNKKPENGSLRQNHSYSSTNVAGKMRNDYSNNVLKVWYGAVFSTR